MSYAFTNGRFTGDLGVGNELAYPLTIALWVKYTDHPVDNDYIVNFGNASASLAESFSVIARSIDGSFAASALDAAVSSSGSIYTLADPSSLDNTWFPIVSIFTSDTNRQIYVNGDTTGANTIERIVTESFRHLSIGKSLTNAAFFAGKIAEVAIWNSALGSVDRTSYEGGASASTIDTANLVVYWSLSTDDDTPDDESGNGGATLSLNGTMDFDSDHPTISSGASVKSVVLKRIRGY